MEKRDIIMGAFKQGETQGVAYCDVLGRNYHTDLGRIETRYVLRDGKVELDTYWVPGKHYATICGNAAARVHIGHVVVDPGDKEGGC